ncbi:ABC transporter substrate-binding protein [Mesorhizobium sp.]|uniref:ABC transporter substrate-binding protein n=1 Tax=Mesorhizobium sp. TaxID=1871066 RepID=UPI000FE5E0A2|nr:ABC transporter substrate-binding protein [Mesorhizobium sp.]RWK70238.1 MAG: carbohydrate ABC transporter substrate-binding protein [Mesorhizobium sp.]RWK74160.1 MAG: carbohydrate ABC transporter substrate-binding protein [Mesorhizobium sp.]RWK98973.1 MAG: carbohydrate ABC transporter substrate-binding protein [Mesorhizobium sp.]RWL04346.1 MAG: carbohydrate ABC transporter substrate-binding protein [Mesorhizobium sp.]
MRITLTCAALALALGSAPAFAQSGEITIWSWNVAASSLKATIEGFNKQFPDIKVTVQDLGNNPTYDKSIAGCAAGGEGLPDIVTIENGEAENYWSQFPDCFVDLHTLGYTAEDQAKFPDFKRTELEVEDKAYAMPWDSGPVAMYYRRDFYEKAGVDPTSIKTWDDFIAAGKKIQEANPGVKMTNADFNGDSEFFRMIANEQGCAYFAADVASMTKIKEMNDAGIITSADWSTKITNNTAGTVATQMYGGWYEGTIRTESPDGSGKWGVYLMPSLTADGPRAANLGGSSLAITSVSNNKEAAYAYLKYSLATNEGQIAMLKGFGLVPSLISALDDPYVSEGQPYWGGQAVWKDILGTLPKVVPSRGTPFQSDAEIIVRAVQTKYLGGGYPDAKAALDDAASQIASATGLPVEE